MKMEFYFYVFKVIDDRFLIWNHESSNKTNPIAHTNAVWPFFFFGPQPQPPPHGPQQCGQKTFNFYVSANFMLGQFEIYSNQRIFREDAVFFGGGG